MNNQNTIEHEKEALKFLERDFNQCFQQMRHYDTQNFGILRFSFTGYTTLISVGLGLYQFGLKESKNFTLPIIAALSIGFVIGLFMFTLAMRNRIYFVRIARYINEQRGLFLQFKPFGFENKSTMYTDCKRPAFFNWHSSQAYLCYIMAGLNSALCGILLFIIFSSYCYKWTIVMGGSFALFIIQLLIAISYLNLLENKPKSKAIFEKK